MGNTVTGNLTASLSYTQGDTSNSNVLTESSAITNSYAFSYGTGIGHINTSFCDSGTILASGEASLNFTNINRSIFGATQTVNFQNGNVKAIIISNASTGYFNLAATGVLGLTTLFNNTGNLPIPPNSCFTYVNHTGMAISSTKNIVQILNGPTSSR